MQALLAKEKGIGKKLLAVFMAVVLAVGVALPTGTLSSVGEAWAATAVSVTQGGSSTQQIDGSYITSVTSYEVTQNGSSVANSGITAVAQNGGIKLSTSSSTEAGTYTVSVTYQYWSSGKLDTDTAEYDVTVTSTSGSSGSTSTNVGNRYYHLDFRIAATVTVTVLNADGTTTTTTVTGTVSNPTAKIYNTSSKTWDSHSWVKTDSETGYKYFDVNFKNSTSSDGGEYEYMMDPNKTPGRQEAEFYNGDTAVLTYTLTYAYNGQTYTLNNLTSTQVLVESNNECNSASSSGTQRGFDIVVSAEDISAALTTSNLQISKQWNDNDNAERPDYITLKVYQTINSEKSHYMTLMLYDAKASSTYSMADGVTADSDMVVTYLDGYGVSITGLPQNHWIMGSDGKYSYESCSYTVEEVTASGNANIQAVYGGFVYVDDTDTDNYIVTITNTLAYDQLAVKKVWADGDTVDHSGDSVRVQLKAYYVNDEKLEEVPDTWLADFVGATTFALNADNSWYQVMGNMPVYYTPEDGEAYEIAKFEVEEISYTVENEETYTAVVTEISADKDNQGNYYFTVTNTPVSKTADVSVSKAVVGNMGDTSKAFTFSAKVMSSDDSSATIITDVSPGSGYTVTDGLINFSLANGEAVTLFGLPLDSYLWLQEINADGYTITVKDGADTEYQASDGWYKVPITSGLVVAFTNDKSANIDTGVSLDSLPYLVILGGALLCGLVLAGRMASRRKED